MTQAQKIKELQDTINDLKKKLEHDEGKSQNKKDKKKDNPYETPGANELKNSKPKRTPLDIYSLPPEEITQNKSLLPHRIYYRGSAKSNQSLHSKKTIARSEP